MTFTATRTSGADVHRAIDRAHSTATAQFFKSVLAIDQSANHETGRGRTCRGKDLCLPVIDLRREIGTQDGHLEKTVVLVVCVEQRFQLASDVRILFGDAGEKVDARLLRASSVS
jgi:hypothetical protein